MYSSKLWLYLSITLVAFLALSGASSPRDNLQRRQESSPSDNDTSAAAPSTTAAAASTTPSASASTSASASDSPTSSPVTSSTPTPSASPSDTPTPSNGGSTTNSPSDGPSSTTDGSVSPSARPTSDIAVQTTTSFVTASVASTPIQTVDVFVTISGSVVTSQSIMYSESTSTPTPSASLSQDNSASGSSSLQPGTRNTIIGVCVGIGGAILLGGLGFVAWRLWGKKRPSVDENEILMAGSSAHGEKLSNDTSPFRTTLDQYHNPNGNVNTASNF